MHTKRSLLIFLSLLLSLLLFFPYHSFAQDKPTAAVIDLIAEQGVSASVSRILSDSLRSSLYKTGLYRLLTRESMEAILKEQTFQLSGCTSTECVVKVGKLLGAQKIFSGTIGKVGTTYVVTLKLFNIETGEIERIEEDRCPKCEEDSLLDSVDRLSAKICNLPVSSIPTSITIPNSALKTTASKDNAQMVLIPAGEFLMGSPQSEGDADNHPQHEVFLDAYYIDKYEVTVSQYKKFCQEIGRKMPAQPDWSSEKHPVVNVSWADATAYANHYGKRLPTEAEWEKAARAGSTTKYCFGDAESELDEYAWYRGNSGEQTHFVGTKKPNAFGLYDMHGNAYEWCSDWYDKNYYANSPKDNPQGPTKGTFRMLRGGSWRFYECRSANRVGSWTFGEPYISSALRNWRNPNLRFDCNGFRCVSSPNTQ